MQARLTALKPPHCPLTDNTQPLSLLLTALNFIQLHYKTWNESCLATTSKVICDTHNKFWFFLNEPCSVLSSFLVTVPSRQGILNKLSLEYSTFSTRKTTICCWICMQYSSPTIQEYLFEDVSRKKRVFQLDRSQRLSSITAAHLYWDLQKE